MRWRSPSYLDLESPADRGRISEPELYFADHADELVILDEIHRAPGIQTGETLAGRIAYVELDPFDISELGGEAVDALWLRGDFPESYLAASDAASLRWREDFIRTYLEREIPQLGATSERLRDRPRAGGEPAYRQHLSRPAGRPAFDTSTSTATRQRRKRQVRSPKTYVRDSGLLHALLGLGDKEALLGHPVLGPSWERYVIENLIALAPARVEPSFYRTSGGAEIDLVLRWPEGQEWAIEVKRSLSPRPGRGMRSAIEDLQPQRGLIVYPGEDRYPVTKEIEVIGFPELAADLS
jgi:uncharacterized protein